MPEKFPQDVTDYIKGLPTDRQPVMEQLLKTVKQALPKGFELCISYKMPAFVVPHSTYPSGYHCDPKQPLPFISLASNKAGFTLYHMGLYADTSLLDWLIEAWTKQVNGKPDLGKGCIRFKKPELIPFGLLAELCGRMSPQDWIACYEKLLKR
jgi:uncharacterized protein YdhG (YjbR/CyaY superfamily)